MKKLFSLFLGMLFIAGCGVPPASTPYTMVTSTDANDPHMTTITISPGDETDTSTLETASSTTP